MVERPGRTCEMEKGRTGPNQGRCDRTTALPGVGGSVVTVTTNLFSAPPRDGEGAKPVFSPSPCRGGAEKRVVVIRLVNNLHRWEESAQPGGEGGGRGWGWGRRPASRAGRPPRARWRPCPGTWTG